jgi:hypothetical protein
MPAGVANDYICLYCDHEARKDALERHIVAKHTIDSACERTKKFGHTFEIVSCGTVAILCQNKDARSTYPYGFCFACNHIVKGTGTLRSTTCFEEHVCKAKQTRGRGEGSVSSSSSSVVSVGTEAEASFHKSLFETLRTNVMRLARGKPDVVALNLRETINRAVELATEEESDSEDEHASTDTPKAAGTDYREAIDNLVLGLAARAAGLIAPTPVKERPIEEDPMYIKLSVVQQENMALHTDLLREKGARNLLTEQKCQAEKELAEARAELERLRAMVEKSSV